MGRRDKVPKASTPAEIAKSSEVHRMMEERLEKLQRGLASFEKIKRFTIMPKEFTMERASSPTPSS